MPLIKTSWHISISYKKPKRTDQLNLVAGNFQNNTNYILLLISNFNPTKSKLHLKSYTKIRIGFRIICNLLYGEHKIQIQIKTIERKRKLE